MLLKEKIEYMSCIDPLEFMQLMRMHDHYFEDYMSCDGGSYYLDEELLYDILSSDYFNKNYSSDYFKDYDYNDYINVRYKTCKKYSKDI